LNGLHAGEKNPHHPSRQKNPADNRRQSLAARKLLTVKAFAHSFGSVIVFSCLGHCCCISTRRDVSSLFSPALSRRQILYIAFDRATLLYALV
jgi:hypothetical protein